MVWFVIVSARACKETRAEVTAARRAGVRILGVCWYNRAKELLSLLRRALAEILYFFYGVPIPVFV